MAKQADTRVGTYTGTGAAINIILGFVPDYVRIINITDGTEAFDWFNGMGAGTAIKTSDAVATQASNGITAYAGVRPFTSGSAGSEVMNPGIGAGITVGTALSTNAKVYRYIATRAS